jgi:hypothetical protein
MEKNKGTGLIHSDEEYLVVTRKINIFALYNVNKHSMLRQKREKRHGHLPCDAREGIKNLSLRFQEKIDSL